MRAFSFSSVHFWIRCSLCFFHSLRFSMPQHSCCKFCAFSGKIMVATNSIFFCSSSFIAFAGFDYNINNYLSFRDSTCMQVGPSFSLCNLLRASLLNEMKTGPDHLLDGNFHTTYEVSSSWRAFFNVVSPWGLIHGVLVSAATSPAAVDNPADNPGESLIWQLHPLPPRC